MSLGRIFVLGIGAYIGLVAILRISGNRTLSKMNAFDFVVTIALGSVFASGLLQRTVSLSDVLFAFVVLVGLQYLTTWAAMRFKAFDRLVTAEPVLLFAGGRFLRDAMKREHITEDEIRAGIRLQGIPDLDETLFVVLEANGKIVAVPAPPTAGRE